MRKIILIIFITLIFNNVAYSNTDCSQLKKLSKDYLGCITKKTKEKTSNLELLWRSGLSGKMKDS